MNSPGQENFNRDLQNAIEKSDAAKAISLMQHFQGLDARSRSRALFDIGKAEEKISWTLLKHLSSLSFHDRETKDSVLDLILDKAQSNGTFILIYLPAATQEQVIDAVPVLMNVLMSEVDIQILKETMLALGRTGGALGGSACITTIADFIYYDNAELKRTAIQALSAIGGPAVIRRMTAASKSSKSDPFLMETLATLLKRSSRQGPAEAVPDEIPILKNLVSALTSPNTTTRLSAMATLAAKGVSAIPALAEMISSAPPEGLSIAMATLGKIGDKTAMAPIMKVLANKPEDAGVRMAAYEAIANLSQSKSAIALLDGLDDPNGQVRLSAAAALDRHFSEVAGEGLKAKIESGTKGSRQIAHAVIDAMADNALNYLMLSDSFSFMAANYLPETHPAIRDHFISLLKKRGSNAQARRIQSETAQAKSTGRLTIYAVDSSRIQLACLIRIFHKLGHDTVPFQSGQDALSATLKTPPHLLITGLNLPDMDGLKLAEEIRARHDENALPVVMLSRHLPGGTATNPSAPAGTFGDDAASCISLSLAKPLDEDLIKPLISKISDRVIIERHSAMLASPLIENRYSAIDRLAAFGPRAVPVAIDKLNPGNAASIITTAALLGRIDGVAGREAMETLIDTETSDIGARFAIFEALASCFAPGSTRAVLAGIEDELEPIRMSAARAIDSNLSPTFIDALQKRIESGSKVSRKVAEAILDAKSDKTFNALLRSDAFTFIASDYLTKSAPSLRQYFIAALLSRGRRALARSIQDEAGDPGLSPRPSIFIVDSSATIRNYFIKKLYQMGFSPETFPSEREAIRALRKAKPNLLIIDHMMPGSSGFAAVRSIRRRFTQAALPIIMTTLHGGSQEIESGIPLVDPKTVTESGIDRLLHHSFEGRELESSIRELVAPTLKG